MDIPGRSVDATLNIQAKTTGLSETAESLTEVRDALSEVAAVSEAAEQQLDSVNDELSRSETEASTAAGGFTALAASMATASQAAESLDDNLDDIDGASVDAFLPTPGDVDDRVSDIEDRISDIDVEDSIDFSQTLTTDGGIDRGDDILTDGGDDVAEEIGEEYEESVEELVDDIIDEIEDTEDGTDELDRLSRRIDELKQGRTDKLSDALGELSADETELLASELKQADSFQEELLIVAAEVQRSLETESDAVESIADDVERTQDEVSDSTDRIERKRDDIEGDRSRLRNAVDALTAPGLLQSLDELFDADEFDTASDNLHDFADKQRDIADGFRDVADAVEERNRAAQSVRSKTDFFTGTEDISLVDDSQRSVKRALDASDIASQRSIELQRPDPDEILSVVDLKVRKMLQALVGGQNEFKDVDAKPTRDGIEILATPETETTETTETTEALRFLSDDSGFRKVTGDAGREIGKVSQSVSSLADNAEELNEAASDASNIFSTLAGTVSQRTDSDDTDIDAEGPEDSDISIREERSRITDIEGSIPKRFRTFLSESELTERRTVDDQDRLDPAVQQRQELMRNADRLSFFQSTLQRLSEKPVLTGEKKSPPKSALQGPDPSRSATRFAIASPDIMEKVSQSTAEQLLQQRDDLLDREERKTTADKISDSIEQTDAFDILVDNEFDMSDEERSRIDKVVNGFANAIANPDDFAESGDGGLSDTPLDTDSARERSELIGKVTDAFAAAELITSRKNIDVPDFADLVETEDTQQTFDSGDDSDVIDVDGEVVDTETVDDTDTDVETETAVESISDEIKRAVLDEFSDSDFDDDVILDATRTALRQRGADDDIDITSRSDEPDRFGEATTPPDQTTLVESVGDILDQRSGGRSSGTERTTESSERILDKLDKFPDMSNVIVARDDGGTPIVDIVGIIEELSELDPEDVFPESFLEQRESGGGGSRGDVEKILGASVIDTDAGRRRVLPGMVRPPATERTSFTDEGELKPLVDFRSADQIRFELENSDILQEVEDGFRQTELFLGQNLSAPGVPDGQATTIPLDPSERFLPPVSERDEKIEQLLLSEFFDVDTTGGTSGSTDTDTEINTDTVEDQLVQDIVSGVGKKTQERLEDELGVRSLSDVSDVTADELKQIFGIGDNTAQKILDARAGSNTQSQRDTFSKLFALSELSNFASVRDADTSIFEEASDADIDSDVVTESPSSTSSRAAFLQAAGADRSSVGGIGNDNQLQNTFSKLFALNELSDFASVRDVNTDFFDGDDDTGTTSMSSRAAFLQAAGSDRDAVDDANVDDPFPTKFSLQESINRAKEEIRARPVDTAGSSSLSDLIQRTTDMDDVQELERQTSFINSANRRIVSVIEDRLKQISALNEKRKTLDTDEIEERFEAFEEYENARELVISSLSNDFGIDRGKLESADDLTEETFKISRLDKERDELDSDETIETKLRELFGLDQEQLREIDNLDEADLTETIVPGQLLKTALTDDERGVGLSESEAIERIGADFSGDEVTLGTGGGPELAEIVPEQQTQESVEDLVPTAPSGHDVTEFDLIASMVADEQREEAGLGDRKGGPNLNIPSGLRRAEETNIDIDKMFGDEEDTVTENDIVTEDDIKDEIEGSLSPLTEDDFEDISDDEDVHGVRLKDSAKNAMSDVIDDDAESVVERNDETTSGIADSGIFDRESDAADDDDEDLVTDGGVSNAFDGIDKIEEAEDTIDDLTEGADDFQDALDGIDKIEEAGDAIDDLTEGAGDFQDIVDDSDGDAISDGDSDPPDPTDIPGGMDRAPDPIDDEPILANKFLRLAKNSEEFTASLSDFNERVDESNIEQARITDVAQTFSRLGRARTLEDTRFADRGRINEFIKDASAGGFNQTDLFQSESPTRLKDIIQQNDEEIFDPEIAGEVFQEAVKKDGGLTAPNINEAIDEVRDGELLEQEEQFRSTLKQLSKFKDSALNVDNAMQSLIDSTETAEIDLDDASEEVDRLNEALEDAFLSDGPFLPFSPDENVDPSRFDLDDGDAPDIRDLLTVFDDLNKLVGSKSLADKNLTGRELGAIAKLVTDLDEGEILEMDKSELESKIIDASEDLSDEETERLRASDFGDDVVNTLVEDEQFAGMGETEIDREVVDALDNLTEELAESFNAVTREDVQMTQKELLQSLSDTRFERDIDPEERSDIEDGITEAVSSIGSSRDDILNELQERGDIDEDEAQNLLGTILRDAEELSTIKLEESARQKLTQDRFDEDDEDVIATQLRTLVSDGQGGGIADLDVFETDEGTDGGKTVERDARMFFEDVLGMSDRVETENIPQLTNEKIQQRAAGPSLQRLFDNRADSSPQTRSLLDLLLSGAEEGELQETIEKTFERRFGAGELDDIQNILDELRMTAETNEEGADIARLRQFAAEFEGDLLDLSAKDLFQDNLDEFNIDDPRTSIESFRPETVTERSKVIDDAFDMQDIGQRRVFARAIKDIQDQGLTLGTETLRASLAQRFFETDSTEIQNIIQELIDDIDTGKINTGSVLLDDRTQERFEDQLQRTIADTSVEGEGENLARQLIQDATEAFDDNDRLVSIQDLFDDDRPSIRDIMELDDDDLGNIDVDLDEIFPALEEALLVTNRLEQLEVAPDVDQLDVDEEVSPRKLSREAEKARIGLGSRQTLDAETAFARRIRQGIVADDIDEIDGLDDESGIVSRIFSIGNAMRVTSDRLEIGDDAALNVSRSLGSFGRALEELKPELGITSASLGAFNISLRNATGVVIGLTGVLGPLISTVAGLAGAFLTLGGAVGAFVGVGALGFLDDLANRMANVKNRTEAAEKLFKAFREEAIQRLDPLRNVSLTIDGQEVGPQELFASGVLESLDVINQFASISANILELRAVENAIGRIMTAFTTSDGDLTLNEALMEFSEELAPTIADMTVFLINNLPELISFLGDVAKTLDQPLGELFIQAVDLAATLTKIGTGAIAVYAKLADVFLKIVNFLGVIISKLGIISDISPVPELFAEGSAMERGPTAEGRMESDDDGGFLPFSLATGFGGAIGLALGLDALTSLVKRVTNSVRRVGMAKNRIGEAIARARGLTIPKSVGGFLSGAKSLLLPGTNAAGGQTASASRAGLQQTARRVGPNSASRLGRVRSAVATGARAIALGAIGRGVEAAVDPNQSVKRKITQSVKSLGRGLFTRAFVTDVASDAVDVGLPMGIGPQKRVTGALGKSLSSIPTDADDAKQIMTDGGQIAKQSGLSRLSNLFGRVPTKLDDIISAVRTVDVSINSLDEILAKGKTGVKQGAGILGRIGGKRALLGAGGALATLGTILTRGKGKGLINLLKGGKTGMIGSLLGKITGISALRRPGIGMISKGIMGLGKKVLPKAVTGALSSGTSSLFKFLGSKGLKSLAQKGGFTMLTKLFAGRAAMAIPVIGQLIGALDLLTMAITFAIPGVEMFSPLTFAMEQLFNATKDFIDFISDLTLDDIIDALTGGGSQEQGRSMPAGPGQRVDPGVNSTQTQPRNPNSPQQQPGMNQSRSANQNTTQTGQGRRPRRDVTINVNGAGENTEGIVTKIMNRLQTEEQKNERFYRGNGS